MARDDRFDIPTHLQDLFGAPSLMAGESEVFYDALRKYIEDEINPQDIFEQMAVTDLAIHYFELMQGFAGVPGP